MKPNWNSNQPHDQSDDTFKIAKYTNTPTLELSENWGM